MRVERPHEQRVAEDGDAAVLCAAAHLLPARVGVAIEPEHATGLRIERDDVVGPLREVHDPVNDQRRRLPWTEHLVLHHPFQLEVLRVRRIDLPEQAVALARVAARVGQPVLRLIGRAQEAIGR